MQYKWKDYIPETMDFVECWLDALAVHFTGLDDGWQDFYEYWLNEEHSILGKNYWCKVVYENETPFAVVALGINDGTLIIMELVVKPDMRNKGMGTLLLKELMENGKAILNEDIQKAEAVIYPSNVASQKVFEKSGFIYGSNEDGDAITYIYNP